MKIVLLKRLRQEICIVQNIIAGNKGGSIVPAFFMVVQIVSRHFLKVKYCHDVPSHHLKQRRSIGRMPIAQ